MKNFLNKSTSDDQLILNFNFDFPADVTAMKFVHRAPFHRHLLVLASVLLFALAFTPAYSLTNEEADLKIEEWGIGLEGMPEDLWEAFRSLVREQAKWANQPLHMNSSTTEIDSVGTISVGLAMEPMFPHLGCITLGPLPIPTLYSDWIDLFPSIIGHPEYEDSYLQDGVSNLTKYALGLDPTNPSRFCLPRPVFRDHLGSPHLALQFTRPDWVKGIAHVLESSDDLIIWEQHHDLLVQTESIPDSQYEMAWILDPLSSDISDRRFLRLVTEVDTGVRLSTSCKSGSVHLKLDISGLVNEGDFYSEYAVQFERSSSPDGPFVTIAQIQYPYFDLDYTFPARDYDVEQGTTYHYRAHFIYYDPNFQLQTTVSNDAFVHVGCKPPPALLVACRPDHIRLNWHAPEWAVPDNWIQRGDWSLMRSEYVEGPFTQIDMGSTYNGEASGFFEDFNVVPDTEYFYYIELAYTSSGVLFQAESTVVGASVEWH